MCGRYSLNTSAKDLAHQFKLIADPSWDARYNIAPTQNALMIAAHLDGRMAQTAAWGFQPPWLKDGASGKVLINARAETAANKTTFADAFRSQRCLIPASSFFEWQTQGGQKLPWLLHLPDKPTFAMAGLWQQQETGLRFTVLTLASCGQAESVHHRMPWILPSDKMEDWLNASSSNIPNPEQTLGAQLQKYRVTAKVNKVAFESPACLLPVADEGLLF
ncbi:MAG: SOS response-associated peptidase [Planctomycetes bacterium]|nr:SOS response-associated peptidase [Planctomycetota bacterium]